MNGKFYTAFIMLFLIWGLLFYNVIGFTYIDELLVAILVLYTIYVRLSTRRQFPKEFIYFLWIILFYVVYSIFLGITSVVAIFYDLQQQMKPFLAFYCTLYLRPRFYKKQREFLKKICVISFIFALCNIPIVMVSGKFLNGHVTNLAALASTIFCLYYYFEGRRSKMSIAMLSIGIFSGRSKFFATYIVDIILIYLHKKINVFSTKVIAVSSIIALVIINYVIWEKFNFYVLEGASHNEELARVVLYQTSWRVINDYFPFGSGFATFANNASGVFYSPLYFKYGLWRVWGMQPNNFDFIADTFYPELAQFGVVGVFLFFFFIYKRYKDLCRLADIDRYVIGMILIATILLESFADTMVLSNRGVLFFMLLGLLFNERSRRIDIDLRLRS